MQADSSQDNPVNVATTGMPAQDPHEQWLNAKLAIRAELRFDVRKNGDSVDVVIEDPVRSKFFQVGETEYRFIASLNAELRVQEVLSNLLAAQPGTLDEDKAVKICQWLVNSNLVIGLEGDSSQRLNMQAKALSQQKLMGLLNPICFKIRLFNPNEALQKIQPYTQWFFSKTFLAVWLLVGLYALQIVYTKWDALGDAYVGILSGGRWFWLLVIWILLKLIHEVGHGVACRKYGGEVPDAGVLMLLFTPMAFVNVTSSWRFQSRWHRIVVAGAGMYVELFLSFLAIIVWAHSAPGVLADLCFNIFVMACFTTILFNANPLMRFDGYYILSDTINVPNLYPKGTKWFGDRLKRLLFGTPLTSNICAASEIRRVAVYGSMAFFWKILISLSLIIGSSVIFHGSGIVLAVLGVGLWFGLPIYKQFKMIFGPDSNCPPNMRRVQLSAISIAVVIVCMFSVLRGPATKSAPAIVQFKNEVPLRADADGFVKLIHVQNGQQVKTGEVLLELENRELTNEILGLKLEAEEAAIQARIFREQTENALAQAEQKNHESLLIQLKEKQAQAAGLKVIAPFDGFVFQRNLDHCLGSFVHRGDEVLNIAQQQTKEIVVSIDQSDLESIKGNEGKFLRVAFPGNRVFKSELVRVNPRAEDRPTHPSLCAHLGGPLPVRQAARENETDDSNMKLLSPRFTADLSVSSEFASELHSGQRGRAFFSARKQSLGSCLYLAVSDWFKKKLEQATYTAAF